MKHFAISTLKNSSRPLRFLVRELEEAVFGKTYRDFDPEELFSATEFEEAVFDETFFDFRISKNPPISTTLLLLQVHLEGCYQCFHAVLLLVASSTLCLGVPTLPIRDWTLLSRAKCFLEV